MHALTFDEKHDYSQSTVGIELPIFLQTNPENPISTEVKLDTGSTYCVFQRKYGELLGIDIETGNKEKIGTVLGNGFNAYGHEIGLRYSSLEWEATVYFAEDENFPRSFLGRNGFLDRINVAILDNEQLLYLSSAA